MKKSFITSGPGYRDSLNTVILFFVGTVDLTVDRNKFHRLKKTVGCIR